MAAATTVIYDVLILGSGPAGLSAATSIARQLYTTVVFDSGVYRNARIPHLHMHNVPTWDHRDPAEFRAAARADLLARYSATTLFADVEVQTLQQQRETGLFKATDATGGNWLGRTVVLATGVRDIFPGIRGYGDIWGRGIFHCLFCHGFEDRGAQSVGVLAEGLLAKPQPAFHTVLMAKPLAGKVRVYTNGDDQVLKELSTAEGAGTVELEGRRIMKLEMSGRGAEVVVTLEDGAKYTEGFMVHHPKFEVNGPFVKQLSLELAESGEIKTFGPMGATSVNGVFAAGDCASPIKAVLPAMSGGALGGAGAVFQLAGEKFGPRSGVPSKA